jgi:hypothetical protein
MTTQLTCHRPHDNANAPYLFESVRVGCVLNDEVFAPRVAHLLALRVPALGPPQPILCGFYLLMLSVSGTGAKAFPPYNAIIIVITRK